MTYITSLFSKYTEYFSILFSLKVDTHNQKQIVCNFRVSAAQEARKLLSTRGHEQFSCRGNYLYVISK